MLARGDSNRTHTKTTPRRDAASPAVANDDTVKTNYETMMRTIV
jgi:hypothetical protein